MGLLVTERFFDRVSNFVENKCPNLIIEILGRAEPFVYIFLANECYNKNKINVFGHSFSLPS